MDIIHLDGSDDVLRAARLILEAAGQMQSAANSIAESVQRLNDLLIRVEQLQYDFMSTKTGQ